MAARHHVGAVAPGPVTPSGSDDAQAVGAALGIKGGWTADSLDSRGVARSWQAARTIEGEAKARDYLARLQAQQADPDELALILAQLYGAGLRGFCRAIEKALLGRTGGAA